MEIRDLFVAVVALSLGGAMLYSSILNEGWCYQMKIARMVSESKGRVKARTFIGSIGGVMILIGLHILLTPFTFSLFQTSEERSRVQTDSSGRINIAEAK